MYEGEEIAEGIFSEAFPTPPEASIYPPWRIGHMLQRRPATRRLTGKKEGQVHLDSYNGQGAWRPWSFSLTEDDDEDLLTDEDAMSQDEEEVLSSSWSGSSEGGEFPNLREPKEKRVQSTKASGSQSGSVPRRPQRKRQGGRRGHYGKSIPAQRHKSRHLKCVLYFRKCT